MPQSSCLCGAVNINFTGEAVAKVITLKNGDASTLLKDVDSSCARVLTIERLQAPFLALQTS